MKKRLIPMLLVMLLLLSASANAANVSIKSVRTTPSLIFNGTTASCTATVRDYGKTIKVTMELWCGNTLLNTWTCSGTNLVTINETWRGIKQGQTYVLKVYGSANGSSFSVQPISKKA